MFTRPYLTSLSAFLLWHNLQNQCHDPNGSPPAKIHTLLPVPGPLGLDQPFGSKKCVQHVSIPSRKSFSSSFGDLSWRRPQAAKSGPVPVSLHLPFKPLPVLFFYSVSSKRSSFLLLAVSRPHSPSPVDRDKNTDHLSMHTETCSVPQGQPDVGRDAADHKLPCPYTARGNGRLK